MITIGIIGIILDYFPPERLLTGYCTCSSCNSCNNITSMTMVKELHAYETDKLTLYCGEAGHYTEKEYPVKWIVPYGVVVFQQEIEDSRRSYLERVVFSSLVVEDSGVYQCGGRQLHLHVEGKALYIISCNFWCFYHDKVHKTVAELQNFLIWEVEL